MYEGYEEIKENSPMKEMTTNTTCTTTESNHAINDGPEPVKPMEDDSHSHSGNCSYDADASNDSIELNLSLDEQQHHYQQVSYRSIARMNPIHIYCIFLFKFFTFVSCSV